MIQLLTSTGYVQTKAKLAGLEQRLATLEKHAVEQSAGLLQAFTALANAVQSTGREQQSSLARVYGGMAEQAAVLSGLQEGEKQLIRLQETLQQNLSALAGAGAFEEAVQSLTAAVHLLTARAAGLPSNVNRLGPRSGAAA